MYAVVIEDGELRWRERPDPEPGDHEIVVRVRGAGVNGADIASAPARTRRRPGGRRTSRAWRWPARWPPWARA